MQYSHIPSVKLLIALLTLIVLSSHASSVSANDEKLMTIVEQGKRIYQEGLLISGMPLKAKTQGNMEVSGQHLACISCHRRSGLGSYEGKVQIPPIAGRILLADSAAKTSPPSVQSTKSYTEVSLKQTIQSGITPDGRALNPLMPSYEFDNQNLDALITYLKTLSAHDSEGADAQNMHFATIISENVSHRQRKLMLSLIKKYIPLTSRGSTKKRHLIQTPESRKALFQMMRRSRLPQYFPARKLQLHVWELKGPHSNWTKQLESYYRKQPVFAVIGGLATGSWKPIHEFCEHHTVPCLFPNTVEPEVDEHDFYNIYFTKGLTVEGEAVAKHLQQSEAVKGTLLQVYRQGDSGAELAASGLRKEAKELKLKNIREQSIPARTPLSAYYWKQLIKKEHPEQLVLWLKPADLKSLEAVTTASTELKQLYLSTTLIGLSNKLLPKKLQPLTFVTHRYLVPETLGFKQVDDFMSSHSVDHSKNPEDRWLIGDTEWAMGLLSEAVRQLKYNSRELLVETVEMLVSRKPPLLYPRLGLAADQRFASKGCYVVPLNQPNQAVWLVPD